MVPPRSSRSSDHRLLDDVQLLRRFARRQLVRRLQPVAQRGLGGRAVDAHHGRVGDERHGPVARHELAEPLERAELVVNARCGENHPVGIAARHDRVSGLAIELLTLRVERPELLLVLREWTVGSCGALPRRVGVDLEMDREGSAREPVAHGRALHGAAAEIENCRLSARQRVEHALRLLQAKRLLALRAEDRSDRHAGVHLRSP